ncbi:MAG: hypothetical protein ABSE73_32110 [Planctomycetota bacterium]
MSNEEETLELPKSKLVYHAGVLENRTRTGKLVARHNLSDISDLRLLRKLNRSFVVLSVYFGVTAWFAYTHSGAEWLRLTATFALALIAVAFAAIAYREHLEIRSGQDYVLYDLYDGRGQNEGFVMTLKREFQRIKQGKPDAQPTAGSPDHSVPAPQAAPDGGLNPLPSANQQA